MIENEFDEQEEQDESIFSPAPGTFADDMSLPAGADVIQPPDTAPFAPLPRIVPDPAPDPAPEPADREGFQWIGDPRRAEAQEGDGMSDLFQTGGDDDASDLTRVDIEKDIIDADEDGTLDDLVVTTEDDIIGDELGQIPEDNGIRARQRRASRKRVRFSRPQRDTGPGMSGMRGF